MAMRFLAVAAFVLCCALTARHDYHMFQLGSYKAGAYLRGLWRNMRLRRWPRKAKKPLVYTPRVVRMLVTHTIILTLAAAWSFSISHYRQILFLTLFALLSPICVILVNLLNSPVERLINYRYIADAKRILREMPRLIVVGVTGSYGKTSTKYFLHRLLSSKFNALMTPESYNTPMGIVKTVRTQLRPVHDVFICEMGARNVGDIKEICDIVKPRHGVITAIGEQHLETFGTVDNVAKTKFELADSVSGAGAPNNGMVFLNYDSKVIRDKNYDKPMISYSASGVDGCDYSAGDIRVSGAGSSFRVAFPDGESRAFETPLIGKHNVQNIMGAVAVADYLGVERDDIAVNVRRLEAVPHRLQLIKRNSIIIIDDAYNSNPSGAKAALETLDMFDGLKIMVTPGMVELGSAQDECNRRFGAEAAAVCDFVVLVGERQTRSILEGLRSVSFPEAKIKTVDVLERAFEFIDKVDAGGRQKVVLLENDLPDNY